MWSESVGEVGASGRGRSWGIGGSSFNLPDDIAPSFGGGGGKAAEPGRWTSAMVFMVCQSKDRAGAGDVLVRQFVLGRPQRWPRQEEGERVRRNGAQEPETKGSSISSSARSSHVMSTSGAWGAEAGRTRSSGRGHVGQGENWLGFSVLVIVSWSTDSWRCVVTLVPRISSEVKGVCSNVQGGKLGGFLVFGGVEVPGVSRSLGIDDQPLASPSSPPWGATGETNTLIEPVQISRKKITCSGTNAGVPQPRFEYRILHHARYCKEGEGGTAGC